MFAAIRASFKFSQYLDTLYQFSKVTQTPFFTINSQAVRIIEDPLDFYVLLSVSIWPPRILYLVHRRKLAFLVFTYQLVPSKGIY